MRNTIDRRDQANEHVRMTFSFRKKGRQVTVLSAESVKNPEICDSALDATHVVTEIKYGFNAFMIFETQATETSSVQEISGALKVVFDLGIVKISGEGDVEWTEEIEEVSNRREASN